VPRFCYVFCLSLVSHDTKYRVHALQHSNHGSTKDELEDLRERHALLLSSGIDVDYTTRVDHLNDRLIARHQTWSKIGTKVLEQILQDDQILAASAKDITQPQRQLLQLGVAQVRPTAVCTRVCQQTSSPITSAGYVLAPLNFDLICPCRRITFSSCGLGWRGFGHRILVTVSVHCTLVSLAWFLCNHITLRFNVNCDCTWQECLRRVRALLLMKLSMKLGQ
jgi:hypothetical protein